MVLQVMISIMKLEGNIPKTLTLMLKEITAQISISTAICLRVLMLAIVGNIVLTI